MQPEPGNGAKPPSGVDLGGATGPPLQFPPGFHAGEPTPHHDGVNQYPPGHLRAQNPPAHAGHQVYPCAGPVEHSGAAGPLGGLGPADHDPQRSEAEHPGQGFHVGAGEDLNYMGGMQYVGAMLHAAEAGVRGSSDSSAAQQNLSLSTSSGTITKMPWTHFQKYASVLLFLGDQVLHRF